MNNETAIHFNGTYNQAQENTSVDYLALAIQITSL